MFIMSSDSLAKDTCEYSRHDGVAMQYREEQQELCCLVSFILSNYQFPKQSYTLDGYECFRWVETFPHTLVVHSSMVERTRGCEVKAQAQSPNREVC